MHEGLKDIDSIGISQVAGSAGRPGAAAGPVGIRRALGKKATITTTFSIDQPKFADHRARLTPLRRCGAFQRDFHWDTTPGLPTHVQDLVGTSQRQARAAGRRERPGTVSWQIDAGWAQDVRTA